DDRDWIAGAHWRSAKRELTNDYAIADSRICLEFHRGDDQPMRLEIRPHLIERLIDQIGHDERRRRRRNPNEQRHRRLRTDDRALRRISSEHPLLLRIEVAHVSRLQILLAEAQN